MDDKQVGVLTDLLHEHQDVVAASKNPFSRTSITQQRIVTGESKRIKQAPRRRALHLKEKADEETEKVLAKSIIEPSSSPWSFPVVHLEKKKGITTEELQKKQRCDPISSRVIRWLESGRGRPKWEQISSLSPQLKGYWAQFERPILKERIPYCKWEKASLRQEQSLKLAISKSLQGKVLLFLHEWKCKRPCGLSSSGTTGVEAAVM